MKLKQHPRYAAFDAWFTKRLADAQPLKGEYFRTAGPLYSTANDIVSGIGAKKGGGRWNAPEVMKVIYASAQPETAIAESTANLRYFNLPLAQGFPKVVVALAVAVDAVLDLTDNALQNDLPEPMANLLAEDWRAVMDSGNEATAQALGRAAYSAGLHGLLVPSNAHPDGQNLLLFPECFHGSCFVEVLKPEELEKLGKPV